MPKRILIAGCQRSGTTLLRLILNSHPLIHCFDEWHSYQNLTDENYQNPKNAEIIGFKIPNWTEWLTESPKDKLTYRNDPILFMMRDVRAVVASMVTLPTGENKVWMDGAIAAIDKFSNNPHKQFNENYSKELARFAQQNEPEFRKAALFWKYKTIQYIKMVQMGYPVLPIRYEHFVKCPVSHLKIIFNFLQVVWDNDLLKHNQIIHDEVFDGLAVGNTLAARAIDKESVWKWKSVLTPEQEQAVLEVAGELNDFVSIL